MNDDVLWCIICQSPHSSNYCAFSQSFSLDQSAQHEDEEEENIHDDVICNMVSMCDDCVDSNLEEHESDITSQRVAY